MYHYIYYSIYFVYRNLLKYYRGWKSAEITSPRDLENLGLLSLRLISPSFHSASKSALEVDAQSERRRRPGGKNSLLTQCHPFLVLTPVNTFEVLWKTWSNLNQTTFKCGFLLQFPFLEVRIWSLSEMGVYFFCVSDLQPTTFRRTPQASVG